MINLHKLLLFLAFILPFTFSELRGQDVDSVGLNLDTVAVDFGWDYLYDVDYEDFRDITNFDGMHMDDCEGPNVDINIQYYQKLFGVKFDYESDGNCKKCQEEAMYQIINTALEQGYSLDNIKRKLAQQDLLKLVSSEDGKIFSIQWNQGGINDFHHILIHQVVSGVYHIQNKRMYYEDDFENQNGAFLIDKIQRVKDTKRYIIYYANQETKSMRLFGADILDNVLNNEYMFGNNLYYLDIELGELFAERHKLVGLKGLQLMYPVIENGQKVGDGFLFYNGFCFTDIESYNKQKEKFELDGALKEGRRYHIISKSSDWANELHSRVGMDLIIDGYTDFKGKPLGRWAGTQKFTIQTELDNGRSKIDSIAVYLPLYDGRACLDGITSVMFEEQFATHHAPSKKLAPQPIYIAGHDEAFTFQRVRYTAVLFDKKPTPEDVGKLSWAVIVDGKVIYLNKEEYRGMQIYLEMNPKWQGKTIRVVPYVDAFDPHFFCETEIISRF